MRMQIRTNEDDYPTSKDIPPSLWTRLSNYTWSLLDNCMVAIGSLREATQARFCHATIITTDSLKNKSSTKAPVLCPIVPGFVCLESSTLYAFSR